MKRIIYLIVFFLVLVSCKHTVKDAVVVKDYPKIYPDYIGVTIPVNIAPLNFNYVGGDFVRTDVVIKGSKGGELHVQGKEASFDVEEWHELVAQNKGGQLNVTVCVEMDGKWTQYKDFPIYVSNHPLDEWGLTYRRIAPGYEVYSSMGLYQRDLSNFDEYAIIENTHVPGMCVNCHTAQQTDPSRFVFHVRGNHGATMFQIDGKREWLKAKNDLLGGSMVYPYWHPTGKYCAFSTNQTRQGFHVVPNERIEVFDLSSDVFVYNPVTHEILTDSLLSTKDWSENTPVFSPDGKTLYYMTCYQREYPLQYKDEKYNLCKIDFDPETGKFGEKVDTIFNAVKMGKSLTWPRPSYDGKYILFTLIDYGYFSIWHNESEQWLLDLKTGEARNLKEINSSKADSYHNWNVNSHWIVFTSRRDDGLYSRLYLTSVDDNGHFTKPFLLPQRHPSDYYSTSLYSYNTPDFTKSKVDFDAYHAAKEIMSDKRMETNVRSE
ncbi:MAG: PD40 domain-containing protein [Prevotella sp.]|nr:PD40 domain-containing protein [Prevotella sp.]